MMNTVARKIGKHLTHIRPGDFQKSISFEEKKKILDDSDRLSTKKLAEKYGKKLQTIRKIKKQREKIINTIETDGIAKKLKHVKPSTWRPVN